MTATEPTAIRDSRYQVGDHVMRDGNHSPSVASKYNTRRNHTSIGVILEVFHKKNVRGVYTPYYKVKWHSPDSIKGCTGEYIQSRLALVKRQDNGM